LSTEEVDLLCAQLEGSPMHVAIIRLGQYTGFRIGELLSLRVADVWEDGMVRSTVTVHKAWMKGKRAARTMPIHDQARAALRHWILTSGLDLIHDEAQLLFPGRLGHRALTPRGFYSALHRAAAGAGIPEDRLGTHSLRKTFATAMYHSPWVNRDLAKLARLLGHANPANTLRYVEFLDNALEQAVLSA
jgi:integrase